jgi:hypothetical protein
MVATGMQLNPDFQWGTDLSAKLPVWLCYLYADPPQNVKVDPADTSVVIMWQPPGVALPNHYNITLTYTNNSDFSSQMYTSFIRVTGTTTELKHDRMIPGQEYAYCVSAIYGLQMSNFCRNFQTHDYVGSSTSSVAVGVLSFIVVLLALLIVLMGVGIVVYPRYIKPRFKDYQQKYRKDKSASLKRQQSVYTMKATPVKGSQK